MLDGAFFRAQLNSGCLLLLDGIDEVPDQIARKAMARLLERAERMFPKTHIVAASRAPALGGETMIPGFVTIQIGPLREEAVDAFVANWCKTLHGSDTEKAKQHQAELLDAIRSRPEIEELATNPVMLTALAGLHWNRARLPDQRTELYQSVLEWLAQAREENRRDLREEPIVRMSAVACLAMMEHLAFTMHTDPRGRQTEIALNAAARALAPRFRGLPEDERIRRCGAVPSGGGDRQRNSDPPRQHAALLAPHLSGVPLREGFGRGRPAPAALYRTNLVSRSMATHRTFARRRTLPAGRGTCRSVLSRSLGRSWARTPR